MRRTSALLAAGTVMLALGLSACGGSDKNAQPPSTNDVPSQADTTSVPGYTLQPATAGTTGTAPVVVQGPAESDLSADAIGLAAATDKYIQSGHTGFANDDSMLFPDKFLAAVGWKAPAGVTLERIDTDNEGGINYEVCLAKASGAWVVYASKQHKIIAAGPTDKSCGDM